MYRARAVAALPEACRHAIIDEDLLQDFNVKYVGALRFPRAVIPFMKPDGGLGPYHQEATVQLI